MGKATSIWTVAGLVLCLLCAGACGGGKGDGASGDNSPDTSGGDTSNDNDTSNDTSVEGVVVLQGAVDKGPFVLGSSVAISPVDSSNGSPTGQVFNTQTVSDLGEFDVEFNYIGLVSLEASGFYYNEVTGSLSNAPITLRAYYEVEAAGTQSAYINLITHLSYNRIKKLIIDGTPFINAVAQAESELRLALQVGPPGFDPNASGTEMNITGGESLANAYLFAVSSVLAERASLNGGPIDASLQELLNTIAVDFADDGDISDGIKEGLWEAQFHVDIEGVSSMLAERLAAVGSSAGVPDMNAILDLDQDGAVNAEDCLIYDPNRHDGQADVDNDGHDHYRCGGNDYDDDCATCVPGGTLTCGSARDHDGDKLVDELSGCGQCVPGTPFEVGQLSTIQAHDIFVAGNIAYVAAADGLRTLDVSNPTAMSDIGHASDVGGASRIFVYGDIAYVASGFGEAEEGEISLVDVSNPAFPEWISMAPGMTDVFVAAGFAYTPDGEMVMDVTNPQFPIPVANPEGSGGGNRIFVANDIAAVFGQHGELSLIDVSDPLHPHHISTISLDMEDPYENGEFKEGVGLFMAGDAVFVAGAPGFAIIDIANPSAPMMAGALGHLGMLSDIFVAGEHAYVVGEHGLFAIDVSDIYNPVAVAGPIGEGFNGGTVFISDGLAYVGDAWGMSVIDLDCGGTIMIHCGDGAADWGEECDDQDFMNASCNDFGFDLGFLVCNDDCTVDSSDCTNCGNNFWNDGEECDGDDLNFQDCWSMGFGDGTLTCSPDCNYDTSGCYYVCGDGRIDPGEECEHSWDPWGEDDLNGHTCQDYGYANEIGLACDEVCKLDPSGCLPVCNNDLLEPGEECEEGDLTGLTCADFGFVGTEGLACKHCTFDVSGCASECNNGVIEPSEDCEGDDLGGATCADLGYLIPSGLACDACMFDDSNCMAICSNGALEPTEECDDGNMTAEDGCSSACEIEEGFNCLGNPSVCSQCDPYHHGETCETCVILVNPDERITERDGQTWSTGFATIAEGIEQAMSLAEDLEEACEVWVRAGTYRVFNTSPDESLMLPSGTQLYGGFAGTESARDQRDVVEHLTIIDGEGPGNGAPHVRAVIRISDAEDVRVDGFFIRGGRAAPGDNGAGAILMNSSVSFVNCTFQDHKASGDGAGIYAESSDLTLSECVFTEHEGHRGGGLHTRWSTVTIEESYFTANSAREAGAGIFFGEGTTATVSDTVFDENYAHQGGGFCSDWRARVTVTASTFIDNRADEWGGAINLYNESHLTVENSIFVGNEARTGGAISAMGEIYTQIVNCTMAGNRAHDWGGAIAGDPQALFRVANSIIWHNEPSGAGSNASYEVRYSDVQGGFPGEGNLNLDPKFVDVEGGDVTLAVDSPCIDAADGDMAPATDRVNFPRYDAPESENIGAGDPIYADMGAYEFNTCGNASLETNEQCEGTNLGTNTDCQDLGYVASGALSCTETCMYDVSNCEAACGNNVIEPTEACEGEDLNDATCETLGFEAPEGLACDETCQFDISDCAASCGNEIIEPTEDCEGFDLSGETCQTQGFQDGMLVCREDCSFDYGECFGGCGNGIWEGMNGPENEEGEQCDGEDLAGWDCHMFGLCGELACHDDCTWDKSGCYDCCGNGQIDMDEQCDGEEMWGQNCFNFGFSGGDVTCTETCEIDTSECFYVCGNGMTEEGEQCDDWDLAGQDCQSLGFQGGGELGCTAQCTFNTTACDSICGNDIIEPDEACEAGQLGDTTCETLGYVGGGELVCTECEFDDTSCIAECGNAVIEPGEKCEDGDLDGQTCQDLGYADVGALACLECQLDATGCVAVCGNKVIEPGETCDDGNAVDGDGCSSACAAEDGWQCLGQPSRCDQCDAHFHGEGCNECIVLVDNDEDITERDGRSWATALDDIQQALDLAESLADGCEVWVKAGTYYVFDTNNQDTIRLGDGAALYGSFKGTEGYRYQREARAYPTVLDPRQSYEGMQRVNHVLTAEWTRDITVDGFTIYGAGDWENGGGLMVRDGSVTIRSCAFSPGLATNSWSSAVYAQNATLTVVNSTFTANRGGGIFVDWSHLDVIHSTFYKNDPNAIWANPESTVSIRGSIIWENQPNGIEGGQTTVMYSLVQGWGVGNGNIVGDPQFINPDEGDLRLAASSPCIDAADGTVAPTTDKDGYARYDDPDKTDTGEGDPAYADMGAYERNVCGNGQLDVGEACEGDDLGQATCQAAGYADTGTLACLPTCRYDTTGCTEVCNNGVIEPGEECDGADLNEHTCQDLGYVAVGALACSSETCQFDTTGCEAVCGNAQREPGEECEDDDLGNMSCHDLGFMGGGDLACYFDCTYDKTNCWDGCGNDRTEDWMGEECDGTDMGWQGNCFDHGFSAGEIACGDDCKYDTSGCGYQCGNDQREGDEACDGWDLAGQNCTGLGFLGGGELACSASCTFVTTSCSTVCGNDTVEPTEACEEGQLGDTTCADLGYLGGGELTCSSCEFDTSGCIAVCGNGTIEPGEACEEGDLNGQTCQNLGYADVGTLACASCALDDSGCAAVCGNGVIEPGETCDDGNTDDSDGCASTCTAEDGWQCLGQPSRCDQCDDYFHGAGCSECIVLVDNEETISTRDGKSWYTALETIQAGIDVASTLADGCEVWVKAGTHYVYSTNDNDTIQMAPTTALYGSFAGTEGYRSHRDPGNHPTTIDGRANADGLNRVAHVITAENAQNAVLDGFTVLGNGHWEWGGGFSLQNGSATIRGCAFSPDITGNGDGGAVYTQNGTLTIENSTFTKNNGTALFADWSTLNVRHSSFYGNGQNAIGGNPESEITVSGSIIWGNDWEGIQSDGPVLVEYSLVQGWGGGTGNLTGDPLFADAENGDLRLSVGSPCIDAANGSQAPVYDKDGHPRFDDLGVTNTGAGTPTYADMGAYESTLCGNGQLDVGELCEGDDVDGATCMTVGYATAGTLACLPTCNYNTTGCQAVCDNGTLEPGEYCDGTALGDATCQDLGYVDVGSLACTAGTCEYDTSGCSATCGNDVTEPTEDCDGTDLGTSSCQDQGFTGGGELSCNQDCTYNLNNCNDGCGNNRAEGHLNEECDGTDMGWQSNCWDHGFSAGTVSCTDECRYDTSDCGYECGNNQKEGDEQCDGWDMGGQNCQAAGYVSSGNLQCQEDCTFDTTGCTALCGNGIVEPTESCEPGNLGDATCADLGYVSPDGLDCTSECAFDTTGCSAACGNGVVEPTEDCEGTDPGDYTCQDLGYVEVGSLACDTCAFDTSGCAAVCGNGVIEPGEACDDANATDSDGCSATCQVETGWQCLGAPSACDACDDYFHGSSCTSCMVLVDRDTGISTRDGKSWRTALATIQEGIDQAAALDASCEVWVASGTYYVYSSSDNDTIQLESGVSVYGGFSGTENSRYQRNPAVAETIIDGRQSASSSNRVRHTVTADFVTDVTFDGFTVKRGGQWDWGGGIYATNAWVTISNCAIVEISKPDGGGVAMYNWQSTVDLISTTFVDNQGGAMRNEGSTVNITNCTIAGNNQFGIQNEQGATTTVVGTIIWGNDPNGLEVNGGMISVRYSDVQTWGTTNGNISEDPMFVDLENDDVRLLSGSPCVDAADGTAAPTYDKHGFPRYDDPTETNTGTGTPAYADMGAYELSGCGNSEVDTGENCDGDVGAATCVDVGYADPGTLTCLGTCRYDTTLCESACGNATLEPGELCEAGNVGDATCQDVGYVDPDGLACAAETCTFDTSGCTAVCDNGLREPGEVCDGEDTGTSSCYDLGFQGGGDLSCNPDCTLNLNNCNDGCGNNRLEGHLNEQCDGTDLGGQDCGFFGMTGPLSCDSNCEFDQSNCTP
ncbi:MAG: right-handed parallel beta-helix repeat-containing protein [Myxococcota bacterium]|nr:right-handed parallel beta-helix repeat-containing protein [Myxococcota bacterium]